MEITKKLLLNKTPKNVPNGALTCAKNIMIDDTGSFITNEWGLSVGFECPNANEFIVGCITCTNEIVIFTYQQDNKTSHIYRLKDNGELKECATSWKYNGGTLVGSYTYNYKNELIIAVSEYGASDNNGNEILVPLKSWNLDTQTITNQTFNIEEDIPMYKVNYYIENNGSLVCGVYTFFIRFMIDDNNYTKWFQITDDIIIVETINKGVPVHHFSSTNDNKDVSSVAIKDANTDFLKDSENIFYNENQISNKSIKLNIDFNNQQVNFSKYQIGYIVKRGSEIVGRIKNTYDISNGIVTLSDNIYYEEESIDNFLINPTQYYNVKNLITYNNRLYISNYSEYKNEDLQSYADKIEVSEIVGNVDSSNNEEFIKKITPLSIYFGIPNATAVSLSNVSTYIADDGKEYINNITDFVRNNIAKQVKLINKNGQSKDITQDIIEYPNDGVIKSIRQSFSLIVFYSDDNGQTLKHSTTLWNSNSQSVDNCKLRIDSNKVVTLINKDSVEIPLDNQHSFCALAFNFQFSALPGYESATTHGWVSSTGFIVGDTPIPYYKCYIEHNQTTYTYNNSDNINYNNLRSLIPGQIYNFFVHYIRKDFSVTNGFKLNNIAQNNRYTDDNGNVFFMTQAGTNTHGAFVNTESLKWVKFSSIQIPNDYIGCLFTYEDIERTSYPVTALSYKIGNELKSKYNNDNRTQVTEVNVTNSEFTYGISSISGIMCEAGLGQTIPTKFTKNINGKIFHKSSNRERYVNVSLSDSSFLEFEQIGATLRSGISRKLLLLSKIDNIYNKVYKTLYRFTPNIYTGENFDNNTAYMYCPGFYNREKLIRYNVNEGKEDIDPTEDGLILSATSSNVMKQNNTNDDNNGESISNYAIYFYADYIWSPIPLNALSIKQDYEEGAVSLVNNDGEAIGVYYNKVIAPAKLHDLFELQACYNSKPNKTYTNYQNNVIDTFNKTIRRSDVISDESLFNGFRWFQVDNYKIIQENKGEIINIIGIGLYFLVHTRYSLFVFDRSNRLNAKAQLEIPDTFDVDYQEVLPSNEGFGGIADKEESIVSKNGYIWFDRDNKYIFCFVNGKINTLSTDINNLLRSLDINYVRFAEDIDNNRILICIYTNEVYYIDSDYNEYNSIPEEYEVVLINNKLVYQTVSGKVYYIRYKCITLSYNFYTNTFISLHDYKFSNNWRTYNKSYLFDENEDRRRLYCFDANSNSYHNLTNIHSIIYRHYENS